MDGETAACVSGPALNIITVGSQFPSVSTTLGMKSEGTCFSALKDVRPCN